MLGNGQLQTRKKPETLFQISLAGINLGIYDETYTP